MNRTFSIAPMLDWTDRHQRFFIRLITKHTLLYTEMVTTGALIHGDTQRYLAFNDEEHPVALQLGGSNPKDMAYCASLAENEGYDEVNINVGCPSDRVQKGAFGACLMLEPNLVAECVSAMNAAVNTIPVTVKCRLGVDDHDSYEFLTQFIETVSSAGCDTFIVHARKAWLKGLSPKQNREVPPLDYQRVYQIKREYPHLNIILNGGIDTLELAHEQLPHVDGVMMGRAAYHNSYMLAQADHIMFGDDELIRSRAEILALFEEYVAKQLADDIYLKHMTRHILDFFHGQPGAKKWRRHLSENANKPGADLDTLRTAKAFCL